MTAVPFRPAGYNAACPYLIVSDAAGTIAFLERCFGATVLSRHPDPEGRLRHAEVRIDDSVVMLADSAPDWPPMPSHVHVYVPDVDATYARALAAGAESVQAPVRKDDPDKRGGVKDVGGTTWWIATRQLA
jgi:PhnB protein